MSSCSHPNFLKESSFTYLPWTYPQPIAIFCTTAALKLLLPRSKAHVSFNMSTTSWYLSCLILGCLKCHWLLRIMPHFGVCELAASPPSFHQFHGSSSPPIFSLLLLCSSLGDGSPSGLSSLALSPHTPERSCINTWALVITTCTLLLLERTSDVFACFYFKYFLSSPSQFSGDSICFSSEDLPLSLLSAWAV